jgi:hypothetical protein
MIGSSVRFDIKISIDGMGTHHIPHKIEVKDLAFCWEDGNTKSRFCVHRS